MDKKVISEEMRLEKEWFEEAKKQTPKTLTAFIDRVMNDYIHDYGTVCHAISACALAAAYAANETEGARGGITGFQAGFVLWDFIRQWNFPYNKCGLKIIDYDNMLYPQYDYRFDKIIPEDVWKLLQKEAKKNLETKETASEDVVEHWKSIVDGKVPYGYTVSD